MSLTSKVHVGGSTSPPQPSCVQCQNSPHKLDFFLVVVTKKKTTKPKKQPLLYFHLTAFSDNTTGKIASRRRSLEDLFHIFHFSSSPTAGLLHNQTPASKTRTQTLASIVVVHNT